MATFQVSPIEAFDSSKLDGWLQWIRRCEHFHQVSNLQFKGGESQVNDLIYFMGDKADDILFSFGLNEEDLKK